MAAFRPAALQERQEFYEQEFDCLALQRWFAGRKWPQFFVIDAGTESGIAVDKEMIGQLTIFNPGLGAHDIAMKLVRYAPEDAYYDTIDYPDPLRARQCPAHQPVCAHAEHGNRVGGELVFDIDSENIDCPRCGKGRDRFCPLCIRTACEHADSLSAMLESEEGYRDIRFVYSGRGVHVHVSDPAARGLTIAQRGALARRSLRFAIDPWVTESKRLIRLPFSLHGLVSRIAIPLSRKELRSFDATDDPRVLPKFLR